MFTIGGKILVSNAQPFVLFGGINVLESLDLAQRACAEYVRNRPSIVSFRGPGLMAYLKVSFTMFGMQDKRAACLSLMIKAGVVAEETACIGDDSIDLPAF